MILLPSNLYKWNLEYLHQSIKFTSKSYILEFSTPRNSPCTQLAHYESDVIQRDFCQDVGSRPNHFLPAEMEYGRQRRAFRIFTRNFKLRQRWWFRGIIGRQLVEEIGFGVGIAVVRQYTLSHVPGKISTPYRNGMVEAEAYLKSWGRVPRFRFQTLINWQEAVFNRLYVWLYILQL